LGTRESASPMIQDFQQTTVASTGLLAQASTVCCGDRLPVSLQYSSSNEPGSEIAGITTQILQSHLSSPVQPTASPCLPGHRHPVKELHSVGGSSRGQRTLDSQCQLCHSPLETLEKSLKPCLSRLSCLWRVATHCQQMEPLLALCLFPGLSHSSLSLLCNAGCRSANRL